MFNENDREDIAQAGYKILQQEVAKDYEITKFSFKFYIPSTREKSLTQMVLAEITVK
jgi:hypothetical protein